MYAAKASKVKSSIITDLPLYVGTVWEPTNAGSAHWLSVVVYHRIKHIIRLFNSKNVIFKVIYCNEKVVSQFDC